jgi:hypothetical protein
MPRAPEDKLAKVSAVAEEVEKVSRTELTAVED